MIEFYRIARVFGVDEMGKSKQMYPGFHDEK